MAENKILILDFGGQYNQLIARRVREQHVYAEIRSYDRITLPEIEAAGYAGNRSICVSAPKRGWTAARYS